MGITADLLQAQVEVGFALSEEGLEILGSVAQAQHATTLGSFSARAAKARERLAAAVQVAERLAKAQTYDIQGIKVLPAWHLLAKSVAKALVFDASILTPDFVLPLAASLTTALTRTVKAILGRDDLNQHHIDLIYLPESAGGLA
eukprot:15451780-Alexandrium_andersonii.AAC.1